MSKLLFKKNVETLLAKKIKPHTSLTPPHSTPHKYLKNKHITATFILYHNHPISTL